MWGVLEAWGWLGRHWAPVRGSLALGELWSGGDGGGGTPRSTLPVGVVLPACVVVVLCGAGAVELTGAILSIPFLLCRLFWLGVVLLLHLVQDQVDVLVTHHRRHTHTNTPALHYYQQYLI